MKTEMILCLSLAIFLVNAQTAESPKKENVPEKDPFSREYRIHLAKEVYLKNLQQIYDLIPTPSPEQLTWLREEEARIAKIKGMEHYVQLAQMQNNKAFHLRQAKEGLRSIIENLLTITTTEYLELTMWLEVSTELMNTRIWDSVKYLQDKKVISLSEETALGQLAVCQSLGVGILNVIIKPHVLKMEKEKRAAQKAEK